MNNRKRFSVILAVLMLVSLMLPGMAMAVEAVPISAPTNEITIYHTNDTHGRIYTTDPESAIISIDKIAKIHASNPNSLLVDAGDTFHGQNIATYYKGTSVVDLMNLAGYDVMVPGNHDFNYGSDQLLTLKKDAEFDLIAANIKNNDGSEFLPGTSIKTVGGIKVGFVGLNSVETKTKTSPKNVEKLDFNADYISVATSQAEALKKAGANVVVLLAHVGRTKSADQTVDTADIAKAVSGKIDLIIDGHDHNKEMQKVGNVWVTSAGQYRELLGQVTIKLDSSKKITGIECGQLATADVTKLEPTGNAAVAKKADEYLAGVEKQMSVIVGKSKIILSADRAPGVRTQETLLGNLVTDAMLDGAANCDFALTNGGGLRETISEGDITRGSVFSVLPFANYLVVIEVTPKLIKEIIETNIATLPEASGGYPQVSGMTYTYDLSKKEGSRVNAMTIGGKAVDMKDSKTTYRMATNDFIAAGGDAYALLAGMKITEEGDSLDIVLENYIKKLGTLTSANVKLEGRSGEKKVVTTTIATPKNLEVMATGRDMVRVSYEASQGATNYKVYRVNKSGKATLVAETKMSSSTVTGENVAQYSYAVIACADVDGKHIESKPTKITAPEFMVGTDVLLILDAPVMKASRINNLITVSWNKNDRADMYNVLLYSAASKKIDTIAETDKNIFSFSLKDYQTGKYAIAVMPIDKGVYGCVYGEISNSKVFAVA